MSTIDDANTTIHAYRRDNGRVGVRNHVLILPLDDISNAACEAVPTTSRAPLPSRTPTAGCNSAPI